METPVPGFQFGGMVKARREAWFLGEDEMRQKEPNKRWIVVPRKIVLSSGFDILFPVINLPDLSTLNHWWELMRHANKVRRTFWNPTASSRAAAF